MTPHYLQPAVWLAAIDGLPRLAAAAAMFAGVSCLGLGLRWFPHYLKASAGLAGWLLGLWLAELMKVTGWYVALPTSVLAVGMAWPITKVLGPFLVGFASACCLGAFTVAGFGPDAFWLAFVAGFLAGVVFAVLASRFTIALFCSACGTLAVLASLGAVVRARQGWLAPGGYVDHPTLYVVLGAVLFVGGMIVQVMFEPDTPQEGMQD